jgi:hypothetical protein
MISIIYRRQPLQQIVMQNKSRTTSAMVVGRRKATVTKRRYGPLSVDGMAVMLDLPGPSYDFASSLDDYPPIQSGNEKGLPKVTTLARPAFPAALMASLYLATTTTTTTTTRTQKMWIAKMQLQVLLSALTTMPLFHLPPRDDRPDESRILSTTDDEYGR